VSGSIAVQAVTVVPGTISGGEFYLHMAGAVGGGRDEFEQPFADADLTGIGVI
jgi:hypothetical protein